ncbi:MAG: YdcF family protein [Burkholderiales bacterium]|nr:YdcF family protein [Burkholderiales bacterium]
MLIRRRPRLGRLLAVLGVVGLLLLSVPKVAQVLASGLPAYAPVDLAQAQSAQALVVLGSGTRREAAEYGGDTLSRRTLERVRYGARLARLTGLPVLVSGGSVYGGEAEGKLMREALESEFRVPVRWTEERSRTTAENARYSAQILRGAGVSRIVLVAHGVDMTRALAEFADHGIDAIPAATGISSREVGDLTDWLPSMAGLSASYEAVYEMSALLVRRMAGR